MLLLEMGGVTDGTVLSKKELRVKKWLEDRKIDFVLFDADDTLGYTQKVFILQIGTVAEYMARTYQHKSRETWLKVINETTDAQFGGRRVNPKVWEEITEQIWVKEGLDTDGKSKVLEMFEQIYTSPLELKPGTEDALVFLKRLGIDMGIVTHANKEWTERKYKWWGLEKFIPWEKVFIVDEDGPKSADSWLAAVKSFGKEPHQCLGVGDSQRSDILPMLEIGIGETILVEGTSWSVHKADVPEKVTKMKDLRGIMELGKSLR